ncbi:MAG: type II secretion system F family protein [Candidatus Sericytochromatia bacterium]|nr:type II secretion system F family protein [Candidatus Sericytochromatia bacterium]
MPQYSCKVRDHSGKSFIKVMPGNSPEEVRDKLREMGYIIVTPLRVAKDGTGEEAADLGPSLSERLRNFSFLKPKVKLEDLSIFTRQLATMINSGVALVRALSIMAEQTSNPSLSEVANDIRMRVEAGTALSDAMAKHPEVFDNLFVGMVRAGEAGGVLDEVLQRIASFNEASAKLRRQVKSAMTYPIAVAIMAVSIFIGMLLFILPVFSNMFAQMNAKLPAYTQFMIDLSENARGPAGLSVVCTIAILVFLYKRFAATDQGRHLIDKYMLQLPVIGALVQKVAVARFTRTLGTLLRSGVPLLSALEIVRDSAGNTVISGAMEDIRQAVREGEGISRPLEKADIFPPMVTQMVSVGEETGQIDSMLEKVADFFDSEVEASIKSLTSLLEPIMMGSIGILVGSIVVAMYLPVFSIIGQVGK